MGEHLAVNSTEIDAKQPTALSDSMTKKEGPAFQMMSRRALNKELKNITRMMMKKINQLKMVTKPTMTMTMRKKAMVGKKLTMVRQAVTQKMMKLILGIN